MFIGILLLVKLQMGKMLLALSNIGEPCICNLLIVIYVQDFDLLVKVFCGDGGPHVRDDDNDARQSK